MPDICMKRSWSAFASHVVAEVTHVVTANTLVTTRCSAHDWDLLSSDLHHERVYPQHESRNEDHRDTPQEQQRRD